MSGTFSVVFAMVLVAGILPAQAFATTADGTPVPESADPQAIRDFWAQLDSRWNARAAPEFSALFTKDASFGFVDRGRSLETRTVIHRHFTEQFSKQSPDLRHTTDVARTQVVAPGAAAVDGTVRVTAHPHEEAPTVLRQFAITAVMVQEEGAWRIRVLRVYAMPLQADSDGR